MISHWIIPISGYTQGRKQRTGLSDLWLELHKKFAASKVCVFPVLPWDHDWTTLARFMDVQSERDNGTQPKVCVIGYSWGGGWGAQRLAEQLRVCGMVVNQMVLADPVYRSARLLGRWRSLLIGGWLAPTIKVPSNVLYVKSTRQRINWPRAHDLKPDSPGTRMELPIEDYDRVHNQMDESPIFREIVFNAAKRLIEGEEL